MADSDPLNVTTCRDAPSIRRVTFVNFRFPVMDGGSAVVRSLSAEFRQRGIEVQHISIYPGRDEPNYKVSVIFPRESLHRNPVLRGGSHSLVRALGRIPLFLFKRAYVWMRARRFRQWAETLGADTAVVFTHVRAKQILDNTGFRRSVGGPIFIGQVHSQFEWLAQEPAVREAIPKHFADVELVTALTESDAKKLSEIVPTLCIEMPNPAPSIEQRIGLRRRVVVACARFSPEKRLPLAVRLFAEATAVDELKDWKFEIYGSGPERASIARAITDHGLEDRVFVREPTDNVAGVYANAALSILTSSSEGMPMSVLEAASRATPTIAFDCSAGVHAMLSEGAGVLVSDNDEASYVAALRAALLNERVRRAASRAAEELAARHAPERVGDLWIEILSKLQDQDPVAFPATRDPAGVKRPCAVVVAHDLAARGGAERVAVETAAALRDKDYSVTLVTLGEWCRLSDIGEYFDIKLNEIDLLCLGRFPRKEVRFTEVFRLIETYRVSRDIRSMRPKVLVNCAFKSEVPGVAKRNIYFVHFPHELDRLRDQVIRRTYLAVLRLMQDALINRGRSFVNTYDLIFANSRFTAAQVRLLWRHHASVLYPPCDLVGTSDGERGRQILAVGRFQDRAESRPHKRQDVLIEAFSAMHELHRSGWTLHLAGSVGSKTEIQRLLRMAEGLPVVFHADVRHEELVHLYRTSAIYWHAQGFGESILMDPIAHEHFGITTVEAMSAGLIPIVYDSAGPKEITRELSWSSTWRTIQELRERTLEASSLVPERDIELRAECVRAANQYNRCNFRQRLFDAL